MTSTTKQMRPNGKGEESQEYEISYVGSGDKTNTQNNETIH